MAREQRAHRPNPLAVAIRAVVGLALLLAAVGVAALLVRTRPTPPLVAVGETARRTQVITLAPVPVARSWDGYGSARALAEADISAEISGVIIRRPDEVEPGARIGRGDLIVAIDPTDFEQRVAQARQAVAAREAELAALASEEEGVRDQVALSDRSVTLLESEIERWNRANAQGAGAAVELERYQREQTLLSRTRRELRQRLEQIPSRRAALEAQRLADMAALRLAEEDLRRTRIVSPIDGAIEFVDGRVGERLTVGQPVARIVDVSRIEAPLRLAASAAGHVRPGDAVRIAAEGASEAEWQGTISRVSPTMDQATRTITVYAEMRQSRDEAQGRPLLLPGQFVRGSVEESGAEPRLVIPRRAIDRGQALVVDATGHIAAVSVRVLHYAEGAYPTLDPRETQWAVIESGLREGDRVVVSNLDELRAGMKVDPVEAVDALAASHEPADAGRATSR